eukprot:g31732.t1
MMAHLAQLGLLVAVPCTQGAGLLPLTMLPCAQNLPQCASSCGVDEFQAGQSALEKQAFELIKDLGLSLLATSLDYVALCQHSVPQLSRPNRTRVGAGRFRARSEQRSAAEEPRCGMLAREFEVVQALRARLDARLREMAKDMP